MKQPLVSIVTPSFNQAQYIEQTILSVASQDYKNIEHIVIDGGSTDATLNTLKKYDHLKWISGKDKGQSDAINKGFKMARGEVIGWLNSDDMYRKGAINSAVKAFNRDRMLSMVYSDIDMIEASGRLRERAKVPRFSFSRLVNKGNFIPQPTVFFRRRILDQVGYLREDYHYAMDYEYWCRIGRAGLKIAKISGTAAAFRFHSNSKTQAEIDGSAESKFWPEVYNTSKKYGGHTLSKLHREYLMYRYPGLAKANIPGRAMRKLKGMIKSK